MKTLQNDILAAARAVAHPTYDDTVWLTNGLPANRGSCYELEGAIWQKVGAFGSVVTRIRCTTEEGEAVLPIMRMSKRVMTFATTPEERENLAAVRSLVSLFCRISNTYKYEVMSRAAARRDARVADPVPMSLQQRMRSVPLTPVALKYDRAIGVEMETFGDISRRDLIAALPFYCRAEGDGSIRADVGDAHEIRCLFPRRELEVRLWRVCQIAQKVGLQVNKSCGMHVHFDQRGKTLAEVRALAVRLDKWLHALSELVPQSRRENTYCKFGVATLSQAEHGSGSARYRAVNICSFAKHKTLEVRLHSGTVDYSKILAWIRLCELCLSMRSAPRAGDTLAVLGQLPLAEHDRAYWLSRHRELNPHRYAATQDAGNSEQE